MQLFFARWSLVLITFWSGLCSAAYDISVKLPSGAIIPLELDSEEPFESVLEKLTIFLDGSEKSSLVLTLIPNSYSCVVEYNTGASAPRDYYRAVTATEKSDIRYYLKNLAKASWIKLLDLEKPIKAAGERTNHIHPLRLLHCILSDEELKAFFHGIRSRKKIWKEFFSGLHESFEKESNASNMNDDYLLDFTKCFKLNPSLINPPVKQHRWEEFVSLLLSTIPREGNPDRYDM